VVSGVRGSRGCGFTCAAPNESAQP
jgi:hypothetical protein